MVSGPLAIFEISAVLMTLIFIALQFAVRMVREDDVPSRLYRPALNSISLLTLSLMIASFSALVWAGNQIDSAAAMMAMAMVVFAIVMLGIAIRKTADAIAEEQLGKELSEAGSNGEVEEDSDVK